MAAIHHREAFGTDDRSHAAHQSGGAGLALCVLQQSMTCQFGLILAAWHAGVVYVTLGYELCQWYASQIPTSCVFPLVAY